MWCGDGGGTGGKQVEERPLELSGTMIRIFPDFSVQVTASGGVGAGGGGGGTGGGGSGMVGAAPGPPLGRVPVVPVPGATNGTPQGVQGLGAYQQRYDTFMHTLPEHF